MFSKQEKNPVRFLSRTSMIHDLIPVKGNTSGDSEPEPAFYAEILVFEKRRP
jgi:hypothetical protein